MVLQNSGRLQFEKKSFFNNKEKEDTSESRLKDSLQNDAIDIKYGFKRVNDQLERTGYLINMHSTEILDEDKKLISAVDYYFLQADGSRFKVAVAYQPYFYVLAKSGTLQEVTLFLSKKYADIVTKVEIIAKEDLDLPNHLIGLKQRYLKLSFCNQNDLIKVRKEILSAVRKNKEHMKNHTIYSELLTNSLNNSEEPSSSSSSNAISSKNKTSNSFENMIDIREYDVPYHIRVSIDLRIFCGAWYTIKSRMQDIPLIRRRDDLLEWPEPVILAYDIETTKLPLKFPDAASDQIMMISYMIDGQGYLITNREIITAEIENFEYTPRPEFEGNFIVFNEPNEEAVIRQFFDHILQVKPLIFVTYNGDFFDWPFVETRAAAYNISMKDEIGFSKDNQGVYCSRPASHMDCLCWVRRDSYLPVGSQNLKAVTKAKLRFHPVEVDPEEMCQLAKEQPQLLSSYSVSDALSTYFLYMKYIHPFIFALCTIIPLEPDEVLRKGSGTLCETLLMVEAFHSTIVFPNKQETELNKLTDDGHLLDQETYVGGHVEALESGVFRADIPCRFRLVPEAFNKLISNVEAAMMHAIEQEEQVPMKYVTNFEVICTEIKEKLSELRDNPIRNENPIIYHLDVGAMYPNIILTNRLQPSAIVNEEICAACDHNRPGATCQRKMTWMWRGDFMPASRNEFQRIKLQLETERFPAKFPGGPLQSFHQLPKEEQAALEKKRLTEYCRKAYKRVKQTKTEERTSTICQKENSFYVDTVRAFRDRRYEYKGLTKVWKKKVSEAAAKGDASEIKSAQSKEVLYDSLQLAHKCILNSFYGYVMRRGARWHSMQMAGVVCYTGAAIITKAREIIEQVGRPLELDTDGIWCILPKSFPENFIITTTHPKKSKLEISYTNAVLNCMVKESFSNEVYHDLVDKERGTYVQRKENSIFFEVDGPYLAMILPASKEEGKRLKKRYAVFNLDGSLAELKGFEVKRRGELQLIKIFQSTVFEEFLKGDSLETCYEAVAKIADYWLDVLFSKGGNLTDSELFDLISENRSMSRKLEDYGGQKSTSISTAKRLAEFLGDQMVKDAGLACKYIISRKPDGAPVTERAIPVAIFHSEPATKRHFLNKWLKDTPDDDEWNIRDVLDWNYYIERLSGTIQKIITIPAAMQGITNPIPRVRHPDWLHKKILEKSDPLKQRKINEIFQVAPRPLTTTTTQTITDIEDVPGFNENYGSTFKRPSVITINKRKRRNSEEADNEELKKNWREVLGAPSPMGTTKEERLEWIQFHKRKWAFQARQRAHRQAKRHCADEDQGDYEGTAKLGNKTAGPLGAVVRSAQTKTLTGFLRRAQRTLLDSNWHIIQVSETSTPGHFRLWALIERELHQIKLIVPRIFIVNKRVPLEEPSSTDESSASNSATETNLQNQIWRKCIRILPRARPVYHLYEYSVPEEVFLSYNQKLMSDISTPDIEGIYETQVPLTFRVLLQLGSVCFVDRDQARRIATSGETSDTFNLNQLRMKRLSHLYLTSETSEIKRIYFYHIKAPSGGQRQIFALFMGPTKKALIVVLDSVRPQMPMGIQTLYSNERNEKISRGRPVNELPPEKIQIDVNTQSDPQKAFRSIQAALLLYKDEKKGPTMLSIQSPLDTSTLNTEMPGLAEFPQVKIHCQEISSDQNIWDLNWTRNGIKFIFQHYLNGEKVLNLMLEQCRYLNIPIGNLPSDVTLFGADLFFARTLQKNNFVLWCSESDRPDLGGCEADDNRLLTELEETGGSITSIPGCYSNICIELEMDGLAVTTMLQAHHVNDIEGTSSAIAFDTLPQSSLKDLVTGKTSLSSMMTSYDETALCSAAFRILRSVVMAWLRDVTVHKNVFADFQIVHFYRWLRSPSALLYDPAIGRTLYNLMRKVFIQLVAEFKRLGSVIIYGSFNKLLISTKKRSVMDGIAYVEYVVSSIRNKEFFHSIDLNFSRCWEYLVWLDSANNGGVVGKVPKGLNPDESVQDLEEEDEEGQEPEIHMNWNLLEYMPKVGSCRDHFNEVLCGFITVVYQTLKDTIPQNAMTPLRCATPSTSQASQLEAIQQAESAGIGIGNGKAASKLKELVTNEMGPRCYKIVLLIKNRVEKTTKPLESQDDELQPVVPDLAENKNPPLEFIKSICKILSLEPNIRDEVSAIKRNMLKLINISEFSDQAVWHDPGISFILQEVICKTCNHCRDIDLCRDEHRMGIDWLCPLCKSPYDAVQLEFMLLDVFYRRTMAYQLQDLQCVKCNEIKMDNMSSYCTCAGEYKTIISRESIRQLLLKIKAIAKHAQMQMLLETIEWNIQANPTLQEKT